MNAIFETLEILPKPERIESEVHDFDVREIRPTVYQQLDENVFEVSGDAIEDLARKTDINDPESLAYLQKRLKLDGVMSGLIKLGLKDGDTIIIGKLEFEYTE